MRMITLRKAADRFHSQIGWLDSWHTFSFADHYDPSFLGFGALRVINDDTVAPGQGFGEHPHRDMEIITYVLSGGVQRMSAGSGVVHSEYNASREEPVHFLQIWIVPDTRGIAPRYEQKAFPLEDRRGKLRLLASKGGREGSVDIRQDANVLGALLDGEQKISFELKPSRKAWLHVARGSVELNGMKLGAGDGAAIADERLLQLSGGRNAEVLLFDLP